MDYEKLLLSIKEDLTKEGLDCLIRSSTELPNKTLLIYAGSNAQNKEQIIEIKVETKANTNSEDYSSVRIDAFFPFIVNDLSLQEVAQFLHFLNLQVEIPGFCLNYLDNKIFYRYVLLSESEHVSRKIIIFLVGIAMFFQDVFGPALERIAKGEVTFMEIMGEIGKSLNSEVRDAGPRE